MKKRKNVIISSEFPPFPGGIGNHAFSLALEMNKNNRDVKVITDIRGDNAKYELDFDSKLTFEVKRILKYKLRLFIYFTRIYYAFIELCSLETKTFILSGKFSLWIGGIMKMISSKHKYIAIVHGSEINAGGTIAKKYTSWCLSRFTHVIAVSNFTKELILEKKSIEVKVINNGFLPIVAKKIVKKSLMELGYLNIITVGNVTFRKGQNNVIAALPQIKMIFPNIHYHIVGIPTEKDKFEKLATQLNVRDNVTFYGTINNEELNELLIQSDVFFMLSNVLNNGDVEGFGIAVLEANACGVPAIGSMHSGIADAIKNNYSGKLVNPKSQVEIVASLKDIVENYGDYSLNATKWSKEFTWDIIIKKYFEIID
ncbi:glycosyltransferase family 4 protein [Flavobacterium jejuense]|uniref:Glycosyltransferase family 4 protein n=1 Tax=Flavobacterium jejuense TaxID=1544455 RepID=A0ABX0ITN0_9FLAO|nr:glycosyltransferase family 4 protein [Flavobacterium jejuense]NHN26179.1 glycosyltransferase family 4 protein [Flavobacterium jejuense]